ncbi:EcoKI restriction-modification system protein HsdS [Stieleria bergensis]|uniref:EcoKI restriction-modification system protein HsdS n=1 Tax=Stieleria bergensis TaxID=2528025 RepID=A0A517SWT3_9BACT|nr:EcoKI restriction-modification system protein HsdS [Planctomycetes bacterium SV_7m_r]
MSVAEKLVDYEVLKREPDVVVAELRPFVFANAGVKAIRELMLELAVTGKLTERLHDDDSAAADLDEIAAARQTLAVSLGVRIKTAKQADARTRHADWPCEWATTSVGNLGVFLGGGTPSKQNPAYWEGDIPWVSPKDMKRPYIEDAIDHVSAEGVENSSAKMIPRDSVLMVIRGMILDHSFPVAVSERDLTINQDMKALVLAMPASREFVLLVFQAFKRRVLSLVQRSSHGTCRLPIDDVANLAFPLPPLAEQKRIVSKVDRLMGICDRLESERRETLSLTDRSRRSVLASLTSSRDAAELASSWRRLSDHFEILHDRPETLADLRQTILALAVQGKLVTQDPDEEEIVLPEIKSRHVRPINNDETPFCVPPNWRWYRLGQMAEFLNGDRGKNYPNRSEYVADGIPFINTGHIDPDGTLSQSRMNYITRDKFNTLRSGKIIPGDLVYCLRGATIGKTAVVEPLIEGAVASSLVIIRLSSWLSQRYAYLYLKSPLGMELIKRFDNGSAQPNLGAKSLEEYVVPTPPHAEQHRIVAKVDRLLAQCDRVAEQLRQRQATTEQLLTATIHRILEVAQ